MQIKNEVISACAGSGKTHALIQRLLLLLRAGAMPAEILAITFTNKAAQEIRQRLLAELQTLAEGGEEWAKQVNLRILLGQTPQDKLNIHTFHSWFGVLMEGRHWKQGWYGPAQIIEESAELALREQAWMQCVDACAEQQALLLRYCSPYSLKALICEKVVANLNAWRLLADVMQPSDADWQAAKQACANAPDDFIAAGNAFRAIVGEEAIDNMEDMHAYFWTQGNSLRKAIEKRAAEHKAEEDLAQVVRAYEKITIAEDGMVACAVKMLAAHYLTIYQQTKDQKNVMSFDDLEYQAYCFVEQQGDINRALFRLNQQFKHILIDEFQDCNPLQWHLIKSWLLAAHGSDDAPSVFIVGDEKQAIYRFRRGDSRLLGVARDFLQTHYAATLKETNECRRCAPAVIDDVNEMFKIPPIAKTVADATKATELYDFVEHKPVKDVNDKLPGCVHWHCIVKPPAAEGDSLQMRNPLRQALSEDKNQEEWAAAIADKLQSIIGHWQLTDTPMIKNKPPRICKDSDCMILLHNMTHARYIANALQARGIAFSLQGRGNNFLQSLACQDILALLRVLLQPRHSLGLAQVLKSPLFAYTDKQINELASSGDLWAALQNKKEHKQTLAALQKWQGWLQNEHLPVHDLLTRIYHAHHVVTRYQNSVVESLRAAVKEDLSALLDYALLCDGGRKPLLETFLAEARAAAKEAKSPIPIAAQGVQMMTIHKAKGLEAPVVVLADTTMEECYNKKDPSRIEMLIDWHPEHSKPTAIHFCLRRAQGRVPRALAPLWEEERAGGQRELKNLWYVAMTRAKQVLLIFSNKKFHPSDDEIGGIEKLKRSHPNHEKLLKAIKKLQESDGKYSHLKAMRENINPRQFCWGLSDYLTAKDAVQESPRATVAKPAAPPQTIGQRGSPRARLRGQEIHHALGLLLSGIDAEVVVQLSPTLAPDSLAAAQRLVASPALSALLDGCVRYEVEAEFFHASKTHRLDLLVEHANTVWVIDYKSGRADLELYAEQLQRYQAAMQARYPQHTIKAALLTNEGEIKELSAT